MKRRLSLLIGLLAATSVYAADKTPKKPAPDPKGHMAITEPEKGGVDYKLQGEYVGSGAGKWGAQVIAMGDGKFHAVFLPGGLPGDGWDAKDRYESAGELSGDVVTFTPTDKVAWTEGHFAPAGVEVKKGFEAKLTGDTLAGKTDSGADFVLKKTSRHSPAEGAKPPAGAVVLFDGSNVDAWTGTKVLEGGVMQQGGETKQKFTDYTLHVEFMLPFMPYARSQGRGNSGVYSQHRYETQVLDSFGVMGMDNQCSGIYTKSAPSVNMCYPPLTWQTYDIDFTAARYENGTRKSEAVITVKFNGVQVQDHFKIDGPTGGGNKENPKDDVQSGPLYLQNHGNPVVFRNVWIVEKK